MLIVEPRNRTFGLSSAATPQVRRDDGAVHTITLDIEIIPEFLLRASRKASPAARADRLEKPAGAVGCGVTVDVQPPQDRPAVHRPTLSESKACHRFPLYRHHHGARD
jgi:hypothetical protein